MDVENALTIPEGKPARTRALDTLSRCLLAGAILTQLLQLLALLLLSRTSVPSNVLQAMSALFAAAVCGYKAKRSKTQHERRLWTLLLLGVVTWACGQIFYLAHVCGWLPRSSGLISNTLWLFFAFPLVLVASSTPHSTGRDAVAWLDTVQAFIFFSTLYALVFPEPGIITLAFVFQVQSVAILLSFALSYSVTRRGTERKLYQSLATFVLTYAGCSLLGYTGWKHGFPAGSLIDLCWSLPFTLFSIVVLLDRGSGARLPFLTGARQPSPSHLRALSALGLTVMSLAAASVLAAHRPAAGTLTATAVFLLFAVRTSTREWQLHSAHAELKYAALHDPLTGLGNRSLLQSDLDELLCRPTGDPLDRTALLFIDLDRFKMINDGLGHAFGDLLLIRVAEVLRKAVRPQDIVARHGGDEFVILLDQVREAEAEALSGRVNEMLRQPLLLEGRMIHVTASIGLVLAEPGASANSMLQDADCAMYNAKGLGKDRAQIFAPMMLAAAKSRLGLETDLRASLAERAIEVQYQPIYRLGTLRSFLRERLRSASSTAPAGDNAASLGNDSIEGFEALARWRHPQRGLISPADFIPIAEDSGLIIELGKQVLREACFQCQEWNHRFGTRFTISVNVSALQFAQSGLLDEIKATLRVSGLDPRLLKLEITESVLLNQYDAAEQVLSEARALGISVCLDDFGTGYSSLSYLLRFPFDVVKIDRSLVQELDRDHRRAEMVRMVIRLAATLKKKIVAEGVESAAELSRLRVLGCDMVQGFLLSRPHAPAAIELLLASAAMAPLAGQFQALITSTTSPGPLLQHLESHHQPKAASLDA